MRPLAPAVSLGSRRRLCRAGPDRPAVAIGFLLAVSSRPPSQRGDSAPGTQPYLMSPKPPHFPTRAKHVVFLFMNGAPSQVDTFDRKPALEKYHGSPYRGSTAVGSNGRPVGHLMRSPFPFARHGQSGLRDQQPVPAHGPIRGRFVRDPLDVHRYGRACLRLPADEHGQRRDRQAEPGVVAELWPGDRERELAQLRGHDRSPRRPDFRRIQLGCGVHAGRLSGHAVPRQGLTASRPRHARGHERSFATARDRPHSGSQP